MARRRRWWTTLTDYLRRTWDAAADDDIFFLAGAIAFNILLAAVPFVLLLLSGLGYALNQTRVQSSADLWQFIDQLLPPHAEVADAPLHRLVNDVIQARGPVGLYSLILFVWFSTRLFGTLRTVLYEVFDIEQRMSIVGGKLFDVQITVVSTFLFVLYSALTAYLRLASSEGVALLQRVGIESATMGRLAYGAGSLLALATMYLMFFALYKYLPNRRIRWQSAAVAAGVTTALFQAAKTLFTRYVGRVNPGSLYTGTLYGLVIIVFWVYYAAVIFILGGEVGRVYELRRVRRLQRATLE